MGLQSFSLVIYKMGYGNIQGWIGIQRQLISVFIVSPGQHELVNNHKSQRQILFRFRKEAVWGIFEE